MPAPVPHKNNVEVKINQENGKAIIEGKTSVPFKVFVGLILQRKVQNLFKESQNEPVIISSDLLTKLASSPEDKMEDRSKLVTVSLGFGMLIGIFCSAVLLLILELAHIHLDAIDLGIVLGVFVAVAAVLKVVQRMQGPSTKQKIYDAMEKVTETFSKF